MRLVVALGGNALLRRAEPMTAENQRRNVQIACDRLAPLAARHELAISHGNGPQIGLLALEEAAYGQQPGSPLDVLGAETQGMIGYLVEQELGNRLPPEKPLACLLTMVEVAPDDPAFADPTKPIGPTYTAAEAEKLADERGWTFKPDGDGMRRVVPSPAPLRIIEHRPVTWLLEQGCVVICAGGGGIPTAYRRDHALVGVEAVIDKDLAAALLATRLEADALLMLTDVDAVYDGWGGAHPERIPALTAAAARSMSFASGSMDPKVKAGVRFATANHKPAAIGALADAGAILARRAGTWITAPNGAAPEE